MSTVRVVLPFPPSVNNLFLNAGKRRIPTPRYKAWKAEADLMLMAQRVRPVPGAVNVRIDLVQPDRRRRDIDNCSKAPLDAIVKAGVIIDDSAIQRLSIGWEESGEPCVVTVTSINPTENTHV